MDTVSPKQLSFSFFLFSTMDFLFIKNKMRKVFIFQKKTFNRTEPAFSELNSIKLRK